MRIKSLQKLGTKSSFQKKIEKEDKKEPHPQHMGHVMSEKKGTIRNRTVRKSPIRGVGKLWMKKNSFDRDEQSGKK